MKIRNERLAAVAAGTAILVGIGSVTAVAADWVTSKDIKNNTIKTVDVRDNTLTRADISDRTERQLEGERGPRGPRGPEGPRGEPGEPAVYQGVNWSIVDRNTIGNGDAYLRAGPSAGDSAPPLGVGSLGLRTGAGTDKASFGNQVDFVGDALADIDTVSYWVYTTGENAGVAENNLPNVSFEVDPTGGDDNTTPNFSTLVFSPQSAAPNAWTELDATTDARWYYTGAAGTASGCNQATYCTLADAQEAYPSATVLTVQLGKGRDYAFSGAVDGLTIGDTTYDFEPFGVTETS